MPFFEGIKNLVGGDGAEFNSLLSHGFETAVELGGEIGERRRRANGPRGPGKRMAVFGVVGIDGFSEIYISG